MSSASRDKLVSVQRATVTKDDYNEDIETWAELRKEWARVRYGNAAERREAAQTQSSRSATFDLADNTLTRALSAKDRIVWDGINWDLSAPGIPISGGELQFTATGATS
ncbi:MAG: head-tail adaptor protein [Pseudomonadota bacterium]|nr:head-tail adaptor protein [Pseudomonadota bacterium]